MSEKRIRTDWKKETDKVCEGLSCIEKKIVDEIESSIVNKVGTVNESEIFDAYSDYVFFCVNNLISQRATRLWLCDIEPLLKKHSVEVDLFTPLFNVGLAFFMSMDFDHAMIFFCKAGEEAEKAGGNNKQDVLLGRDKSSRRYLVSTIHAVAYGQWSDIYEKATGFELTEQEFDSLIKWLEGNLPNAIQLITSLHRLASVQKFKDNSAANHLAMASLSQLIVILESSLRFWQSGDGMLQNRIERMLSHNSNLNSEFQSLHTGFCNEFTSTTDRHSLNAINWTLQEYLGFIDKQINTEKLASASLYITLRLRNSLFHVLNDTLDIYSNRDALMKCIGAALISLRLSKHGADGTLAGII